HGVAIAWSRMSVERSSVAAMRVAFCVLAGLFTWVVVPGSVLALRTAGSSGEFVFSSTFAGDREIFTSAADGSSRTDVSNDRHADVTPAWSADGRRIAFASNRSGSFEIYVMNADGSDVVQVTHDHAYDDHPHFTEDDKALVYESTRGGNWEIRRVAVDGSGET